MDRPPDRHVVIFGGLLLVPADPVPWRRAWGFLSVVVVGTVATMVRVFPGHEDWLNKSFEPPSNRDTGGGDDRHAGGHRHVRH